MTITESQIKDFMRTIPNHLNKMNYGQLTQLCNLHFSDLPIPKVDFTNKRGYFGHNNYGGLNILYRARHITNSNNTPHENISDISFIPEDKKEKIKTFGRINKPRESMFYGSLDFATTCVEAVSKGNVFENTSSTMLTVGVWGFETPLRFVQIPHSVKYFERFYKKVGFKSEKIQLEHIKESNSLLRESINNDFAFDKLMFFADEFAKWDTQEDTEYMISNYFVDRVFDRIPGFKIGDEIDGIIYPSTSLSYQEKNIVLKPDVVTNKMKFYSAMQVWFVSHMESKGGAQFIPIKQGIRADENGKLKWN